jgi:hypothetical protein
MRTQRLVVPVIAGVAVFGTVSAFAASLNLGSGTLGSDEAVVAACDATTQIRATYDTVFLGGAYVVDEVTLSSPVACEGLAVKVTLTDGGVSLGEVTGTVAAGSTVLPVPTAAPATPVLASAVDGVAVVVAG